MKPEIDVEKCTGCGDCMEQCVTNAVALVEGKAAIVRPEDCIYCTECEAFCSTGAIRCPFDIILAGEGQVKREANIGNETRIGNR